MSPLSHLLLFVGVCLVGSLPVAGAMLLAARRIAGNASRRHLVFLAGFVALLALPLAAAVVPSRVLFAPLTPTEPLPAAPAVPVLQIATMAAADVPANAPRATKPAPSRRHRFDLEDSLIGGLALWGVGLLWFGVRGVLGAYGLMRLHRHSVPYRCDAVDLAAMSVGVRRWSLRLAASPGGMGPITWGVFRPVVLLPKAAVRWPAARLKVVFLHELAHLRRGDSLSLALARLATALYWPNPLVWICARKMRRDAEIAADDAVLRAGVRPSAYAEELMRMAVEFRPVRGACPHPAMAASGLEARVRSVLSSNQSRLGATAMDMTKYIGVGCAFALALAFARPSFAEEPAAAPDAAPAAAPAEAAALAVPAVPAEPAAPARVRVVKRIVETKPGEPPQVVTVKVDGNDLNAIAAKVQAEMAKPEVRAKLAAARGQARAARAQARVALMQIKPQVKKTIEMAVRSAPGVSAEEVQKAIDDAMKDIDDALADLDRQDEQDEGKQ